MTTEFKMSFAVGNDERRIFADRHRLGPYFCPDCNGPVGRRDVQGHRPFFYHLTRSDCPLREDVGTQAKHILVGWLDAWRLGYLHSVEVHQGGVGHALPLPRALVGPVGLAPPLPYQQVTDIAVLVPGGVGFLVGISRDATPAGGDDIPWVSFEAAAVVGLHNALLTVPASAPLTAVTLVPQAWNNKFAELVGLPSPQACYSGLPAPRGAAEKVVYAAPPPGTWGVSYRLAKEPKKEMAVMLEERGMDAYDAMEILAAAGRAAGGVPGKSPAVFARAYEDASGANNVLAFLLDCGVARGPGWWS